MHHIVPISKGGSHNPSNLEVLCNDCHEDEHGHAIGGQGSSDRPTRLQKLQAAQAEQRQIRIGYKRWIPPYEAPKPAQYQRKVEHVKGRAWESTRRLIDIYFLQRREEKLYIVAYCHLEGAVRTFRLDRIRWTRLLDGTFTVDQNLAAFMKTYFPFTNTCFDENV